MSARDWLERDCCIVLSPWRYVSSVVPRFFADTEKYAEVNHTEQTIRIAEDIADDAQDESMLHELLHVGFRALGLSRRLVRIDADLEEDIVDALAPFILRTMRDNPDLFRALLLTS